MKGVAMGSLLRGEWRRIRSERILWIVAAALCAFGAAYADPADLAGIPLVPDLPFDLQGMFMQKVADTSFAYVLVGAAAAAFMLGRQFSARTVGLEISSGHDRAAVFGVRCATCMLVPVALAFLGLVAGTLRCVGSVPVPPPESLGYFARTVLLLVPAFCALAAPSALFVAVFRDAARSTAATVVFVFLSLWTMAFIMSFAPLVPGTVYTNDPNALLLLHPAFLVRWILRPDLGVVQAVLAVIVCLGWVVVFFGAAWAVLRRCDVK